MEVIIWIVAIILIIAIVWWLLSRNSSGTAAGVTEVDRATPIDQSASSQAASGVQDEAFYGDKEPAATAENFTEVASGSPIAVSNSPVAASTELPAPISTETSAIDAAQPDAAAPRRLAEEDQAEWDTQWSEASSSAPAPSPKTSAAMPATTSPVAEDLAAPPLLHHTEYTDARSATLPGAETAAAEAGLDRPGAGVDPDYAVGSAGHLVSGRPYGEGSSAPTVDGSGPEGYPVKGNAGSMTYEEETSTTFNDSRADVWFESAAHAEAAGFRAPRRTRS